MPPVAGFKHKQFIAKIHQLNELRDFSVFATVPENVSCKNMRQWPRCTTLKPVKTLQVKDPQVLRSLGIDHLGYKQIQPDYPMPTDTNLNCGQRFNKCQEGTSQFHPNNWDMRLC